MAAATFCNDGLIRIPQKKAVNSWDSGE
jgi:hypothetical protein